MVPNYTSCIFSPEISTKEIELYNTETMFYYIHGILMNESEILMKQGYNIIQLLKTYLLAVCY